jgi:hypothetical protein
VNARQSLCGLSGVFYLLAGGSMDQILFIGAAICFLLDAFHISGPAVSWTPLAFALITIALFLL